MRNLLNPKWLLLINTFTAIGVFLFSVGEFSVIETLLTEDSIQLWKVFLAVLALLIIASTAYAFYLIAKKKLVSVYYGFAAFLSYIPYLYSYVYFSEKIMPLNSPWGMTSLNEFLPGNVSLYAGAFLMPTLAYAFFVVVITFTSGNKNNSAWKNFLMSVTLPVSWYGFVEVIFPFWQPLDSEYDIHVAIVMGILITLIFLFFLFRGIYILVLKTTGVIVKYHLVWKIVIALIFPLLGLALNVGMDHLFGNFSNIWFYVLAIINAMLICAPNLKNMPYRLSLFIGRGVTFSYTSYFFLVFLPYLPISIVAIIAMGLGFLMLTPLVLFVVHVNQISVDWSYLQAYFSKKLLWAVLLGAMSVLPLLMTAVHFKDRLVLTQALNYIYSPDYSKKYSINKNALSKTLHVVTQRKKNFTVPIPYLSAWFKWIVLGNMTLSYDKMNTIENVFFNTQNYKNTIQSDDRGSKNVNISGLSVKSSYDAEAKIWTSWVDLKITNHNSSARFAEYVTTIHLPPGCWINDYYLYVGDTKDKGILTEKKSAVWVFSQIRNENKDPGLLYYLTGNKVAFRVFPFAKNEIRKTGIQFIHKEPVSIDIDGRAVRLGQNTNRDVLAKKIESGSMTYVSVKEKQRLVKVLRKPVYNFVVDMSVNKEKFADQYAKTIKSFVKQHNIDTAAARIVYTNTYVTRKPFESLVSMPRSNDVKYEGKYEGGFYLERAIQTILFDAYTQPSDTYPVIIVVAENLENAVIQKDFSDFSMAYPDKGVFYHLDLAGHFRTHSLSRNPKCPLKKVEMLPHNRSNYVLAWPNHQSPKAYLPDNALPSLVYQKTHKDTLFDEGDWSFGLLLQGMWLDHVFYPYHNKDKWLELVKKSFASKIMTPLTSYIVVENEAQKVMLKKAQKQALSGNNSLDLGEDVARMSEPSMVLMLIAVTALLMVRRLNSLGKSLSR